MKNANRSRKCFSVSSPKTSPYSTQFFLALIKLLLEEENIWETVWEQAKGYNILKKSTKGKNMPFSKADSEKLTGRVHLWSRTLFTFLFTNFKHLGWKWLHWYEVVCVTVDVICTLRSENTNTSSPVAIMQRIGIYMVEAVTWKCWKYYDGYLYIPFPRG